MKRLFLNIAAAIFTISVVIIWFDHTALIYKLGYTGLVTSLFWFRQAILWDWEYIKNQRKWSKVATCLRNNAWQKTIDTGAEVEGQRIVIDVSKTPVKYAYLFRWSIYEDQKSGVTLLRDNLRLVNCWYIMY